MGHNNATMVEMLAVLHVRQKQDSVALAKQVKNPYAQQFVETALKRVSKSVTIEIKQDALVVRKIQSTNVYKLESYLFAQLNDLNIKFILNKSYKNA